MPDRRNLGLVNRMVRDDVVDARHDVLSVLRAPRAPRPPEELLAVAGRAPEVHLEDEIAVRGEILILEIEAVLVRAVGAAVVRDNQRVVRAGACAGLIPV